VKVSDLPYGKFRDKAIPIDNFGNYNSSEENLVYVDCLENIRGNRFVFATGQAMFKQVDGSEFDVSKRSIAATKLSENDKVVAILPVAEATHVALRTKKGIFLRFEITEVPEKKKAAIGVRGIKLTADDVVEEVYLLDKNGETAIVYNDKTIALNKLKLGHRDTKGTKLRI
jgi:DNA gyrase subunit A